MRTFIGSYPRVMWGLAIALVISAVGESFFWPLTTTYIVHDFGKSLHVAALVLTLQYTGTLIGNVVGGLLFDKWSGRKTVFTAISLSVVLLVLMGTTHHFPLYVCLLFVLGICNGTFWPSSRAFAAILWPEGGRTGQNLLYVANNLGVAIGSAIGGIVASHSFRAAFYGNAVLYGVFLFLFMSIIKERTLQQKRRERLEQATRPAERSSQPLVRTAITVREMLAMGVLIFGLMLLVVTYSQWQTTISNYMLSLGFTLSSYSVLWAINGVVIVLFQPLLSYCIKRFSLSLKAQILIGGCFFAITFSTIAGFSLYPAFVIAMVIITWGEMLVWPAVPSIAAEMAPVGREGFFQGLATAGQSIGRMIGPLFGSMMYEAYSAGAMLSSMIVLAVLAWVCFFNYDRLGKRKTASVVEQRTLSQ
ncbi:MAG: MDR family MFS transporter [Tumebacillaceae bacterium]